MREFLHSKRFKVLLVVLAVLVGFMLYSVSTGSFSTAPGQLLSFITTPFQKLSSSISGAANGFFGKFAKAGQYANENEQLRKEAAELRKKLADYEKTKTENEQLREAAGLKETYPDFEMATASVIGRDPDDSYGSFTIDKGSMHGVKFHDPVMTSEGLIGYISDVGPISSRVTTILSPEINVGAYEIRTKDIGNITGEIKLSEKGFCKLEYLPRESGVTKGDIIVTSGVSGIFPEGLIIGTVDDVQPESSGVSTYAVIRPASKIEDVKNVVIIKTFLGQGIGTDSTKDKQSKQNQTSSTASGNASSKQGGE